MESGDASVGVCFLTLTRFAFAGRFTCNASDCTDRASSSTAFERIILQPCNCNCLNSERMNERFVIDVEDLLRRQDMWNSVEVRGKINLTKTDEKEDPSIIHHHSSTLIIITDHRPSHSLQLSYVPWQQS